MRMEETGSGMSAVQCCRPQHVPGAVVLRTLSQIWQTFWRRSEAESTIDKVEGNRNGVVEGDFVVQTQLLRDNNGYRCERASNSEKVTSTALQLVSSYISDLENRALSSVCNGTTFVLYPTCPYGTGYHKTLINAQNPTVHSAPTLKTMYYSSTSSSSCPFRPALRKDRSSHFLASLTTKQRLAAL